MHDWKETRLWSRLQETEAAATLRECMPNIQTILSSAGTMPIDFTLHDSDHSFRVAERAAELLPDDARDTLSSVELAQLLLAAYLHDIGMSPNRETYTRHKNYLLTGEASHLSERDRAELQNWLDENRGGVVPPISGSEVDKSGVLRVDELLAYYCRARHNDWSEKWIRENLIDLRQSLYHGWIDDLVALCKSHHEDILELRTDRFDMRVIGAKGEVLNLRYLAALLRLADVLEFDPERTPEVIMKHRAIVPASKVYWQKDHSIAFTIHKPEWSLIMAARTPDAVIHRAVLETVDWVNNELTTCATLHNEGLFKKGNVPDQDKSRYSWPWPPQVRQDVREKDSSFVYIDGGFRPDKVKILNLLSGTNLYGDRWAAVRELLQNAVDAVREQMARERLLKDSPGDPKWEDILGEAHKIRISFEGDGASYYLVCTDDGVGMDRNIIANHLLVSGSSRRGDLVALERAATNAGFSVGRTGQFGIGLLSYFMIAQKVTISTRRSPQGGDADGTGWRFAIEGLDSFGELRTESRATYGTTVALQLSNDVIKGDPAKFAQDLFKYIRSTLRFSPCPVDLVDQVAGREKLQLPMGWTRQQDEILAGITLSLPSRSKPNDVENLPLDEQDIIRQRNEQWELLKQAVVTGAKLFGPHVKKLDGCGLHRSWIAYFELEGGASLNYLDISGGVLKKFLPGREVASVEGLTTTAWRGFGVGTFLPEAGNLIFEVNLTEGAEISVDRRGLRGDSHIRPIVGTSNIEQLREFLSVHSASDYSLLNLRHAQRSGINDAWQTTDWKAAWPALSDGSKRWSKIEFPCVDVLVSKYDRLPDFSSAEIDGTAASVLAQIDIDEYHAIKMSGIAPTGKLAFLNRGHYFAPSFTWDTESELRGAPEGPHVSDFPEGWERIAAIVCLDREAFNRNNAIVASVGKLDPSNAGLKAPQLAEIVNLHPAPEELRRILLANARNSARFWNGFRDNFPAEFRTLIDRADLPRGEFLCWHMMGMFDDDQTLLLTRDGATVVKHASGGRGMLLRLPDSSHIEFGSRMVTLT